MPLKNTLSTTRQYIKIAIILSLVLLIGICFTVFVIDTVSFSSIKSTAMDTLAFVDVHPIQSAVVFAVFYFLICTFPMPFVSVFTMVAGYFFGNVFGLFIVSFMSALGGTVLFLIVRYGLRDWVQRYVVSAPNILQQAAATNSFMAALSVRFIPGLPFSFPSIVLGLSQLTLWKFYFSTQLGLLLTLFVYVNAGRSLAQVNSVQDVFSAELIISMLLVMMLALLVKVPWVFARIHKK
jgi:uncharacterized membrane protein YdjX (TVP38/TMEM64 family)